MLTNRSNYNYEVVSIEYQINNNEKRENGKEIYRRRDATVIIFFLLPRSFLKQTRSLVAFLRFVTSMSAFFLILI